MLDQPEMQQICSVYARISNRFLSTFIADVPTRGRPRESSAALKTARVALRKRFGQHFLKNADVVKNIVGAAAIQPDESVFEIGPGSGNMTVHLLEQARVVYAVELDARLFDVVNARAAQLGMAHKFQCVRADFLEAPLPAFDVMVANIPYQISSPVLRRLFAHRPLPKRAVIMFQKEFTDRIVAQPGTSDYCRLAVNTQLLCSGPQGRCRVLMKVGKEQFRPPPKVDSSVAELVPRPGGWEDVCTTWPSAWVVAREDGAVQDLAGPINVDFDDWDCFLRLCFGGKNKTLRAIFSNKNSLADVWAQSHEGAHWLPGNSAPGRPAAATGIQTFDEDSDGASDDDDDDIVDVVREDDSIANSQVNARPARHGVTEVPDKQVILALREGCHRALAALSLSDKRPNALTIPEYQRLFRALSQGLGLRFKPLPAQWGSDIRKQAGQAPFSPVDVDISPKTHGLAHGRSAMSPLS